MKNIGKWAIPIVVSIIGIITPICWDLLKEENKELTIQEEKKIGFLNSSNVGSALIYNDSVKLDNHNYVIEYSITNTGNVTIVGVGPNSDLLTADNRLCIASDSTIVKLYDNDYSVTLNNNHIYFKQIRPGEKISLICITNKVSDKSLIQISDRDIKDTDVIYTKYINQLTTFEKTAPLNRWIAVIFFLFNLLIITFFIIIEFYDFAKEKPLRLVGMIIWVICLLYTMSLPLRWLL